MTPVDNAAKTASMDESQLNPPWQATNPTNLNPLGLPPEMAATEGKALRGGAYPSGRAIPSEKYGLIDNPQNVHQIGPNFGIDGGANPPTDRPRFYPKDFLTDPEPSTVTPPTSFKATNLLFNAKNEEGFTLGQMEPVHPVPCSIYESDGSGLCNETPKTTKSVADDLMRTGPNAMLPKIQLGGGDSSGEGSLRKSKTKDAYSLKMNE